MAKISRRSFLAACAASPVVLSGCPGEKKRVVVYTALDEMYSRPILDDFEHETGIPVEAVFDTEASKTTGLVTRLAAEKDRPRADVFWNNEVVQTLMLQKSEMLEAYRSPAAALVPNQFKDPRGFWTGFAARARVIIYNTNLVSEPPHSIFDLLKKEWKGRAAIGNPLFGTTLTHASALFALWGADVARGFFLSLKGNGIAVLAGNSTVRDMVARGEYAIGLTDTDDANGAVEDGLPAKWVLPDQGPSDIGTLVIPNTVSLIAGGPNPEGGKKLIDFLLRPETEYKLSSTRSIQIPLNPSSGRSTKAPGLSDIKPMNVSFVLMAGNMKMVSEFIYREFLA